MTTAELYRSTVVGATTAVLGLPVPDVVMSRNDRTVVSGTTEEMYAHLRAMRELAALSFDPESLDRDLEDEINRNAWGISEA